MTDGFELIVDEKGRLVLVRPGQEDVPDVRIRRAFPWSSAAHFVSIRSSEGKEMLLIDDLSSLPGAQRQIIEKWLDGSSFIPTIQRVMKVDVRFGYQQWKVQTDRGEPLRRLAFVALLGVGSLLVAEAVLALSAVVRARGIAFDFVGAAAAAAALVAIAVFARSKPQR